MNRRMFLATSAAVVLMPLALRAAEPLLYAPGSAEADMAAGKIVLLDFWASWCSTCAAQERVLTALKEEIPAYAEKIIFYKVDWDLYATESLARGLNIPRRSTLVLLRGRTELGRIVAGTGKDEIRALLDLALTAG
jgi:thiol-disulfide isomerase/thioredoxin